MGKLDLQKELLEKVKEGVKPSDLKRSNKPIQKPIKKHEQNPNKTESKTDEGYSSDKDIPKAPPLPTEKIKELQNQIKSLQTQLQTYKDFKEADLKIKEKYKKEIEQWKKVVEKSNTLISDKEQVISNLQTNNKVLNKTIKELKKEDKNPIKVKSELFTCYNCKNQREISLLVLELPEGKLCQPCWQVLRKKTKEQTNPTLNTSFTCHNCQQTKKEPSFKVKLDATLQEYSVCSNCLPLIKEYNEKELDSERELDIWE